MLTALLDACVLYPAPLRDLLLSLGVHCPIRLRWSTQIHDEWTRNLLTKRKDLTRAQVDRTRSLMDQALPDALVTNFEPLIDTLTLPDPDDRHVLAAAIHAKADLIVTWNLKDFPSRTLKNYHLVRENPDVFIVKVITEHEESAIESIRNLRARLRHPPVTTADLMETFAKQKLAKVVAHLRQPSIFGHL